MEDRTVTTMRLLTMNGVVLTYDTDDVEDMTISTPSDVIDITQPGDKFHRRKLGQAHLDLHIDFKPGTKPLWIDQAAAFLPDLRVGNEILRAALDAEEVPAELASRIWNRFFFGAPDGPEAVYRFDHDSADCPERVEVTRMRDSEPQWMHGKTCTEAALLKVGEPR